MSATEGGNPKGKQVLSQEPEVKKIHVKDESGTSTKVKKEDIARCGEIRLLTMAGLFDCWQAPKVCSEIKCNLQSSQTLSGPQLPELIPVSVARSD